MFFRVVIASFFLGVAAITQVQQAESYLSPYLIRIYALIAFVYCLTFIYACLLPAVRSFRAFAYVQIMLDIACIALLVFMTGGINSIFSFMFSLAIISASILLYRPGGVVAATVSSLAYSLLIGLQGYGLFPQIQSAMTATGYGGEGLYYPIIVNVAAFYLVSFLSSFLAEQALQSKLQLQKKQADLEDLAALNEHIIQSIHSGLVTLDNDGLIITFNRAAQGITGLSFADVRMKKFSDIFAEIDPALATLESTAGAEGQNPRFETRFIRPDGKAIYLGFSIAALRDGSGHAHGRIFVFQDLTSLKELQMHMRRMDRLAAVGRLAAGIAHEVRNPLASISGSIQVLQKNSNLSFGTDDKHLMDIIVRESKNLSLLISDFTEFARPDAKIKERVKLKFVVDDVLDIFKNSPESQRIIRIERAVKDDIFVYANYYQLRQVFWNLLLNAAQATGKQEGAISIRAMVKEHGFRPVANAARQSHSTRYATASWAEIQVEDNGSGIEEHVLDKIFDPFYTTKDRGTGLGLSIVHKIIEEHDGAIGVKSTPGRGTAFSVYLPCYEERI